jgi:hypothetical protein
MCRTDITPEASGPLGQLLAEMAEQLATAMGANPADVVIGPVDFGEETQRSET